MANDGHVQRVALAIDDALDVAYVLRPAGDGLVDDQVLGRADSDRLAGSNSNSTARRMTSSS